MFCEDLNNIAKDTASFQWTFIVMKQTVLHETLWIGAGKNANSVRMDPARTECWSYFEPNRNQKLKINRNVLYYAFGV